MRYRFVLLLCLLLAAAVVSQQPTGPPKRVSFAASVAPLDPFSDENRVGATPTFRRGGVFLLTVRGVPRQGYYTYPIVKAAEGQNPSQLSKLTIAGRAFAVAAPVQESEPKRPEGKSENKFDAPFTWTLPVVVRPTAEPGQAQLIATAVIIACDEKGSCEPEKHTLNVPVVISDAPPLKLTPELEKAVRDAAARETAAPPPVTPEATFPGTFEYRQKKVVDHPKMLGGGATAQTGLAALLVAAFLGGLISLATPCVFPMIPITVSIFLKQSEAGEGNALLKAAVYSITLVVVLTLGGIALVEVLNPISQHWATNLFLTAVFVFFGLSLLGMYDITLPSWLSDWTSSGEGKGGLLGIVFMALTFSIISFACVGPIYGGFTALTVTGGSSLENAARRVLPPLVFSLAFAAPFFVLALFPGLMRKMPRSGSWMNTVKVVMGFLELAAAFKFVRGAEVGLWYPAKYFTFDLVLGVYVALALACGLYLLNLYRLPHDHDAAESIGVGRLSVALCFFTVAVYLVPGLFKDDKGHAQKPRGVLYDWTRSFLVPEDPSGWLTSMPEALARAEREGKPLFIDFTAPG